jgi:uncharacterized protein YjbK
MSTNIEIEAKTLISEDDYHKFIKKLSLENKDFVTQTNHYLETPNNHLLKHGISLRVRDLKGCTLTCKIPLAEGLLEKNQSISKDEFKSFKKDGHFPDGDISLFLESIGVDLTKLKIVASLETKRYELDYLGCKLAVDENIYGHNRSIIDYELEMEGSSIDNANNSLVAFCKDVGIKYELSQRSKQKRAMDAML